MDESKLEKIDSNQMNQLTTKLSASSTDGERMETTDKTAEQLLDDAIDFKQNECYKRRNLIIIWLDRNTNETDEKYFQYIVQIRKIHSSLRLFNEVDQCIDFTTTTEDATFIVISSANIDKTAMTIINDIPQVTSIFVLNNEAMEAKYDIFKFNKVKGIYISISSIIGQLEKIIRQDEQYMISTNIFSLHSNRDLDELDQSYMYSVLLKEILLQMDYDKKSRRKFFKVFYEYSKSDADINKIDEMDKLYDQHSPLYWYKANPFIYSILNTALRTQDVAIIIKMGSFLKDLHQQIEEIHGSMNHPDILIVYRGQKLPINDFEKMKESKGALLSFNNFLSTTYDRKIALKFATQVENDSDFMGILFDMEINPLISKAPFAPLNMCDDFPDSDGEVLFSMHTIFRIADVIKINDCIWNVKLIMTNDTDTKLEHLTNRIREEIHIESGLSPLANLLYKMGQFDTADEIYHTLLQMLSDDNVNESAYIYNQLGRIFKEKGQLEKSLSFLENALEIQSKLLPCDHSDMAMTYNNIGMLYNDMGQYSRALSYYEKALEIRQNILAQNHPDLGTTYNNIGSVYNNMGEYQMALQYYVKTLEIRQKYFPLNHPDLAAIYNDIGLVYDNLGEYIKALIYYKKTLEIRERSLPSDHPSLAGSYNNIGLVYREIGNYSMALVYLEKTLEIQQKILPSNHPDLGICLNNIGWVYYSTLQYLRALEYFERSLRIGISSLPSNHPQLALAYNAIGLLYNSQGEHSKGLSYLKKTLDILEESLPSNHPSYADTYNNIGSVYKDIREYETALSYYEKALRIRQQNLALNHPHLAITYDNIGFIYKNMGNYKTALSYYEQTLQIQQTHLPSTHLSLAETYINIGQMHSLMKNYSSAIPYYKKALKLQQINLPCHHPTLAVTNCYIGCAHAAKEHYSYALQYYEDALKIQLKIKPIDYSSLSETYNNVGEMYFLTGDCLAALPYFKNALEIQKRFLPFDNQLKMNILNNICQTYTSMKSYEDGLSYSDEILSMEFYVSNLNPSSFAMSHYSRAKILSGLDRPSEALEHASRAAEIISRSEKFHSDKSQMIRAYFAELSSRINDDGKSNNKNTELWSYPIILISSSKNFQVYSILKTLADVHINPPIRLNQFMNLLKSTEKFNYVVFDMSSVLATERDDYLEMMSYIDDIKSIYIFGTPPETRAEQKLFFDRFQKVSLFCEDEQKITVELVLSMTTDYRARAMECIQSKDKITAKQYFQRGIALYTSLREYIGNLMRKI